MLSFGLLKQYCLIDFSKLKTSEVKYNNYKTIIGLRNKIIKKNTLNHSLNIYRKDMHNFNFLFNIKNNISIKLFCLKS
jgi:hypothetical protein